MIVQPFLMFEGKAEEAMNFYVETIPNSRIVDIQRYGPGTPAPEGTVMRGTFSISGQTVLCTDSFVKHGFTFTPSISFFLTCASEEELRQVSSALKEGGAELMPADNYGFSRLFAWVSDRFGVSWQLNLE